MNKKLLILLGVYVGGVFTALKHNKKNPSEIKSELYEAKKSGKKDCGVLFSNFIQVHKNFFFDLRERLLTEENKNKFYKKRDGFLHLTEDFKKKAQKVFEEYKEKGVDYMGEGLEKLEDFYKDKLIELDNLRNNAPEKFKESKEKLVGYFEDFKSKIKK